MANHIPIFLSADDNYAPFVATTIASICYTTKYYIDFFVLDGGISKFNKMQIESLQVKFINFSIEFIKIETSELINYFHLTNAGKHLTISTYSRFLIPQIKENIDRVIYLDVDIIALSDIIELYNEDIAHHHIGAVPKYHNKIERQKFKNVFNLSVEHKYFNAGVLLINCKKWRNDKITEKIFDLSQKFHDTLNDADQGLLNIYFDNSYKQLDYKYNIMTNDQCKKGYPQTDVVLRHFNDYPKPWNNRNFSNRPIQNFNEFWFFASLTPFYAGMCQSFLANMLVNAGVKQEELFNNIKKPSTALLGELRKKLSSGEQKHADL